MRLVFCIAAVSASLMACEPTNQGYAPAQPIAYSHAIHAGVMQIECRYCHYAAERSRHAGIPPASICMNCHKVVAKDHPEIQKVAAALADNKPIEWVRVHSVPDHVFFDHAVHVRGGVVCQTCHGPIEQMGRVEQWAPLTMGWCLDCHRERTATTTPDSPQAGPLTDCAVCHH